MRGRFRTLKWAEGLDVKAGVGWEKVKDCTPVSGFENWGGDQDDNFSF